MLDPRELAEVRARVLHEAEEREKAIAEKLPPGLERDEHWMLGERLSDAAWAIEEEFDLESSPSGLWPVSEQAA
ncbi:MULTISPECIES: hypothetical protein [Sphingomonas]|uniref:hypothetical protein n=1 Tax=Sphingomonas TaxID=13687 RepID=UPI00082F75A5|nr:hypothetical protein [Sphingomonas pituitosa]